MKTGEVDADVFAAAGGDAAVGREELGPEALPGPKKEGLATIMEVAQGDCATAVIGMAAIIRGCAVAVGGTAAAT